MTANLAAVLVVFGIGSFWLHKSLPKDIRDCPAVYSRREWLKVSLPLSLIVGLSLILKRIDIIMIGAMRGSEDAGLYSSAVRVSNLLVFGLMAVNAILAPMISELYYTGRRKQLQRIVALAALGIFAFTVLAGFLLVILGRYCLGFFGESFVAAHIPLLILLCGQIVNALAGPVSLLTIMTGHQNQAGAIIGTNAVLNIILNALLIPRLGLIGAAISTAFSLALCNVLMLICVWRKLRINPTIVKVFGEVKVLGEKSVSTER
jgi:O-antigen/teichoic acid export membrane protein